MYCGINSKLCHLNDISISCRMPWRRKGGGGEGREGSDKGCDARFSIMYHLSYMQRAVCKSKRGLGIDQTILAIL